MTINREMIGVQGKFLRLAGKYGSERAERIMWEDEIEPKDYTPFPSLKQLSQNARKFSKKYSRSKQGKRSSARESELGLGLGL